MHGLISQLSMGRLQIFVYVVGPLFTLAREMMYFFSRRRVYFYPLFFFGRRRDSISQGGPSPGFQHVFLCGISAPHRGNGDGDINAKRKNELLGSIVTRSPGLFLIRGDG